MKLRFALPVLLIAGLFRPDTASASLTTFQTFVGNVALSTDGWGSTSQSGTISASVPVGATVLGAYLYSSTFGGSTVVGGTLNGTAVPYGSPVVNPGNGLATLRADVTSIVAPIINGGAGGIYNFGITENNSVQNGEALVVVYSEASLPNATVAILDGYTATGGDTASLSFATPLDPGAAGFFADMRLGIGHSCCNQESSVRVNGTLITSHAGNNDDGVGGLDNGQLITVGGFDDPYSSFLPSYTADHERYNLVPQVTLGDTSIVIKSNNPSGDDNIFLATFYVSGEATVDDGVTTVPEPATLTLVGLTGVGMLRRRFARQA